MEPITTTAAIIGVTQFVKLLANEAIGYEFAGAYTVVLAAIVAVVLSFVSLDSQIVQAVYAGAVAVGGLTGIEKIAAVTKK